MTDKEKFRKEVEKLKSNLLYGACSSQVAMETMCKEEAYNEVLAILDTMQEEPVNVWHDASKEIPTQGSNILMVRKEEEDINCPPIAGCFHGTNSRFDGKNWGYYNGFVYNEIEPPVKWAYVDELLKLDNPCNIGKDLQEPQVKESAEIQHKEETCKENGNSLTQEPASNPIDFEQELYKAFGQIKDFTLGVAIAKRFYDMGRKHNEPVSEDLEEAADNALSNVLNTHKIVNVRSCLEMFRLGAKWQKKRDYIPLSDDINEVARQICNKVLNCEIDYMEDDVVLSDEEECVKAGIRWQMQKESIPSKDLLEELINNLSKRYPEVSFAKLSRIAVRVAKWQKENLWKSADGDDLPEYEREVIVLIKYYAQRNIHDKEYSTYRVGFGHRPNPDGWDGKNIDTNEVTHYTPKLYDKGGWNAPDIVYWLDIELPKEIKL